MVSRLLFLKQKYLKVYDDIIVITTIISVLINLMIGLCKGGLAIIFQSKWFMLMASYYIVLSLTRGILVNKIIQLKEYQKPQTSSIYKTYHRSGLFIILLGVSFFAWCCYLYQDEMVTIYLDYILYGVVALAFYKIGSSIHGLVSVRKYKNHLFDAIKKVCFLDACVSIVNIQAMLLTMGNSIHASTCSAFLGMGVSFVFVFIGLQMARKNFI